MLVWNRDDDGWFSNGYRIRLVGPHQWELLDRATASGSVITEDAPLAVTRTLTQCKREAELLDTAVRRSELRKRYWGLLVFALVGFGFLPSFSPATGLIALIVLLSIAARAAGVLAGTYMARSHLSVSDLFYQ